MGMPAVYDAADYRVRSEAARNHAPKDEIRNIRPMITLHCGWPKTGTTSLQVALADHRDELLASGVVYPDRWGLHSSDDHNGLPRILTAAARESGTSLDDTVKALADHFDRSILLSAEGFSSMLLNEEARDTFIGFLRAAMEVASVTCVWSLRRFDDMTHSGCIHMSRAMLGNSPTEFAEELRPDVWFSGLRQVEDAVDGRTVYVKYDPAGSHNAELLRSFGVSTEMARRIDSDIKSGSRLNASRSHKQLSAIINAERLSARSGVELDRQEIRRAFHTGGLEFARDRPCELLGPVLRSELHRRALEVADRHDLSAYECFFGNDEMGDFPEPMALDPDVLNDEDLDQLVAHLGETARCVS